MKMLFPVSLSQFLLLSLFFILTSAEDMAVNEFVSGNAPFSSEFYKKTAPSDGVNFVMSSLALELAASFLQSGCKGKTAEEIRSFLFLPSKQENVEKAVSMLVPNLNGSQCCTLDVAVKIYVTDDVTVWPQFKQNASDLYSAEIENINFTNSDTAQTINSWLQNRTHNKIQNVVNADILANITSVVLINSMSFAATWSLPFLESNTRKADFYRNANDAIQVETMYLYNQPVKYRECGFLKAKFLEMAFVGQNASMVVILPNEKEGLGGLEKQVNNILVPHHMTGELVDIALPKFFIETSLDLTNPLKQLGVMAAFDKNQADLSGIAGNKGDLILDGFLQKTLLAVKEGGVETARTTVAANASRSFGSVQTPGKKQFTDVL